MFPRRRLRIGRNGVRISRRRTIAGRRRIAGRRSIARRWSISRRWSIWVGVAGISRRSIRIPWRHPRVVTTRMCGDGRLFTFERVVATRSRPRHLAEGRAIGRRRHGFARPLRLVIQRKGLSRRAICRDGECANSRAALLALHHLTGPLRRNAKRGLAVRASRADRRRVHSVLQTPSLLRTNSSTPSSEFRALSARIRSAPRLASPAPASSSRTRSPSR